MSGNHRPLRCLGLGLVLAGLLSVRAHADQPITGGFPRLDSGARGTALGGNLTAVVEGPEAISWNPAGLLALERKELAFTYADLFGLGLVTQSAVQFGWPRFRTETRWEKGTIRRVPLPPPAERAIGLLVSGLRGDLGTDGSYLELQTGLAYAWRSVGGVQAGAVYRFLSTRTDLKETGAKGHAIDLGLLRPLGPFRLGVSAANLYSTTQWRAGTEGTGGTRDLDAPLARRWSAGLAWVPRHRPFLAVLQGDWSGDSMHALQRGAGMEWRPVSAGALRAGYRRRFDALGGRNEWSAGLGLRAGGFRVDYGFTTSGNDLGETHRWTAGLAL